MQLAFSSGLLYGITGSGAAPSKFAELQDVSIDITYTTKELYGQNQFAIAIARGTAKLTGKAKAARLNGAMLNNIFFGQTNATGQTQVVVAEAATIPATPGPYTYTALNGATFKDDLGVTYVATGVRLTRVASAPTVGQYSVSNVGLYTFAAADQGLAIAIDYSYTVVGGNTTTIVNQYAGTTPQFIAVLNTRYNGQQATLRLNACVSSKLTFATKLDDFTIPEYDFVALVDATGTLGTFSLAE